MSKKDNQDQDQDQDQDQGQGSSQDQAALEADAKTVATHTTTPATLTTEIAELKLSLLPVTLLVLIAGYIGIPTELQLLVFASCSQLLFAAHRFSLSERLPSLQLQVMSSERHTAVLIAGQLFVCGAEQCGQSGLGGLSGNRNLNTVLTFKPVSLPVLDSKSKGVIARVVVGGSHTFLLTTTSQLFACGDNQYGQLGLGNNKDRNSFTPVNTQQFLESKSKERIEQVVVGELHTLLWTTTGRLFACGGNRYGQLGLGDNKNHRSFRRVPLPAFESKSKERIARVVVGGSYTFLLTTTGQLFACGDNWYGQLGLGDNVNRNSFTRVDTGKFSQPGERIAQVAASLSHTALLTKTGKLFACGNNMYGQLGLGDNENRHSFTRVPLPLVLDSKSEERIAQVMVGESHTILLTTTGRLFACGSNGNGQLGLGDNVNRSFFMPVSLPAFESKSKEHIARVVVGGAQTFLLTTTGQLFVCGDNKYGQLGLGDNENRNSFTPVARPPWQDIAQQSYALLARLPIYINMVLQSKSPQLDLRGYYLGDLEPSELLSAIAGFPEDSLPVHMLNLANNHLHHWPIADVGEVLQAFLARLPWSAKSGSGIKPSLDISKNGFSWQDVLELAFVLPEFERKGITVLFGAFNQEEVVQAREAITQERASSPSLARGNDAASSSSSSFSFSSSSSSSSTSSPPMGRDLFASCPPLQQIIDAWKNLFTMSEEKTVEVNRHVHWLNTYMADKTDIRQFSLAHLMQANLFIYQIKCKKDDSFLPLLHRCCEIYITVYCTVESLLEKVGSSAEERAIGYELLANMQRFGENLQDIIKLLLKPAKNLRNFAGFLKEFNQLLKQINDEIQSGFTLEEGVSAVTPCIAALSSSEESSECVRKKQRIQ